MMEKSFGWFDEELDETNSECDCDCTRPGV